LIFFDGFVKILVFKKAVSSVFNLGCDIQNLGKVFLQEPVELQIVRMVGKNVFTSIIVVQTEIGAAG
jgi:hypothetical protein